MAFWAFIQGYFGLVKRLSRGIVLRSKNCSWKELIPERLSARFLFLKQVLKETLNWTLLINAIESSSCWWCYHFIVIFRIEAKKLVAKRERKEFFIIFFHRRIKSFSCSILGFEIDKKKTKKNVFLYDLLAPDIMSHLEN